MARTLRTVYTNFSSGELNNLLNPRTDASAYFNGLKKCRNWYLLDEGGLMRRPGTTYKATLPGEARIIPFIFSNDELAIFVLTNNRLDVYDKDGASIQTNITTNCNWATAELFEVNFAQFGDTVFVTHRDNPIRQIKRTSATTFEVSVDVGTKNSPPSVNICRFLDDTRCLISFTLSEDIATLIASSALPLPTAKFKYSPTFDAIT
jgi:hypothetical protein